MDIHHLNCATLRPRGRKLFEGEGGILEKTTIITQCFLLDTDDGLALVDTGFGLRDVQNPGRVGRWDNTMMNPVFEREQTAHDQIKASGRDPDEVKHIFLTHLDIDHAGGLADFPGARVHLLEDEYRAADAPGFVEKLRYRSGQWEHEPRWYPHEQDGKWFDFPAVEPLPGELPGLYLVSLPGHSPGHAGVAVPQEDRWILHAGDAYFDTREIHDDPPECSTGFRLQQWFISDDNSTRKQTQGALRELVKNHSDDVTVTCSHSTEEFERLRAR